MKALIATTCLLLSLCEGRFQLGWCPSVPRKENFNYTLFNGTWHEIYRDKNHYQLSNQKCTNATYQVINKGKNMKMKRQYKRKFWHWDILWNMIPNIGDQWFFEYFYNPWMFNKDESDYIEHIPALINPIRFNNIYTNEHTIVETDYDDWALVYGCSVIGNVFKYSYATFLSRETNPGYEGVEKAKKILKDLDYPYEKLWVNAGEDCGWGAEPTLDYQMLDDVFGTPPKWSDYTSGKNEKRFRQLYNFNSTTDIVTGDFGSEWSESKKQTRKGYQILNYNGLRISHFFRRDLIADFNYEKLLTLKNIQYLNWYPDLKVDVQILTHLNDSTSLQVLEEVAANPDEIYCCYEEGGGFRNKGFLKNLMTGYARIILWSEANGIEKIQEGKFKEGELVGLGRTHAMEISVPSPYYSSEQHYTGWFPSRDQEWHSIDFFVGNGIAVTDKKKTVQGTFGYIEGFPNEGKDFENPSDIFEYEVYNLKMQERPNADKDKKQFDEF